MEPPALRLTVKDIMQRDVLTLSPEMRLTEAVDRLVHLGISGAPVVDAEGRLLGMLTEKDCIKVLAAAAYYEMPPGTVAEHMVRRVDSVDPDTDLFSLAYHFHGTPYRRVPVVDSDGRVVGLVARRDLIRGLDRIRRERGRPAPLPPPAS